MTHFYKPYNHPIIDAESGMTDEQYHAGIQFRTSVFKHGEGENVEETAVVYSQGITNRGGQDFIFLTHVTDADIIASFVNALVIQLGVIGFRMLEDEEYRVINVPQPKYFRQFLPPAICLCVISEEMTEWLHQEKTLKSLELEPDEVPRYTIVFYDEEGRAPNDPDFNKECIDQLLIAGVTMSTIADDMSWNHNKIEEPTTPEVAAVIMQNFDSAFDSVIQGSDGQVVSVAGMMHLNQMAGGVTEAELDAIREEDEAWDREINPNRNDGA